MKPNYIPDEFWRDGIYDGCMRITLRYKLHPDNQHGEMAAAVMGLLTGYVGLKDFVPHLRERINDSADDEYPTISEATAKLIADDIRREVLFPVRDILVAANPAWHTWLSP